MFAEVILCRYSKISLAVAVSRVGKEYISTCNIGNLGNTPICMSERGSQNDSDNRGTKMINISLLSP